MILSEKNNTLFFTDSGPMGETSLENPTGSVFAIDLSVSMLKPVIYNKLAYPSGLALSPEENVLYVSIIPAFSTSSQVAWVRPQLRSTLRLASSTSHATTSSTARSSASSQSLLTRASSRVNSCCLIIPRSQAFTSLRFRTIFYMPLNALPTHSSKYKSIMLEISFCL
jgi:hypothetical protein